MTNPNQFITHRINYLKKLIDNKTNALKNAPEGSLRANKHKKSVQYYLVNKDTKPNGRYLKKSEQDLAYALAQKGYDKKVLAAARKEHALLSRLNALYKNSAFPEALFEKEPIPKQSAITPIQIPDKQYVSNWISAPYTKLDYINTSNEFYSDNEEKMRSKSEVIIANRLKKYGVPYRYECALNLDGKLVYPDFTILNVRLRQEIYWEHLGMMDDPEYLERNLIKILRYEMNEYFPGDRLIITCETTNLSLNMKLVDMLILKHCL